jgi:hypothetical protein
MVIVALVDSMLALGLKSHLSWLAPILSAVVWSLMVGATLGIPLGLFVQEHILRYWLIYVAAASLFYVLLAYWSEFGLSILLVEWGLPEYWLTMLAVLCFAWLSPRLQRRVLRTASVAP